MKGTRFETQKIQNKPKTSCDGREKGSEVLEKGWGNVKKTQEPTRRSSEWLTLGQFEQQNNGIGL